MRPLNTATQSILLRYKCIQYWHSFPLYCKSKTENQLEINKLSIVFSHQGVLSFCRGEYLFTFPPRHITAQLTGAQTPSEASVFVLICKCTVQSHCRRLFYSWMSRLSLIKCHVGWACFASCDGQKWRQLRVGVVIHFYVILLVLLLITVSSSSSRSHTLV